MARRSLLERIEAAPPTDVIAVIDDELATTVGAREVSFLIADYQGRAVVRFDRSTWSVADGRDPVIEHSETIALHGVRLAGSGGPSSRTSVGSTPECS